MKMNKLKQWFEENDYRGLDPFELYSKRHKLTPSRKLNFVLFKTITEPFQTESEKQYSDVHAFLLKTAVLLKNEKEASKQFKLLKKISTRQYTKWCWGHEFRFNDNPNGYPYTISTLYAVDAILDYYEAYEDKEALSIAENAGEWLVKYCYDCGYMKYSPQDCYHPHNVTAMGGWVFHRLSVITGSKELKLKASNCINNVFKHLGKNHWSYSETSKLFDVLHNCVAYSAVFNYFTSTNDPRLKELTIKFKLFLTRVRKEPLNLWDYSKLLECLVKFNEPFKPFIQGMMKLWNGSAFTFSKNPLRCWRMIGFYNKAYIRHNAFAYYALNLAGVKNEF